MSVEELAAQANLSVGTIRAIEQGRRAPSESSGVRLLQVLLPEGALAKEHGMLLDYSFTDPQSGTRVLLEFKAKAAGDNRSWSSDKPRASESQAEARLRALMSDPERMEFLAQNLMPALQHLGAVSADLRARMGRPAGDAAFGNTVRRLATADEFRLERIGQLLDLWDAVDGGAAEETDRRRVAELHRILDSHQSLPDEEVPFPTV